MAFLSTGRNEFSRLPCLVAACGRHRSRSYANKGEQFSYHLDFQMQVYERDVKSRVVHKRFHISAQLVKMNDSDKLQRANYDVAVRNLEGAAPALERKVHFDYDAQIAGSGEPKPASHLQFCGRLNDSHRDAGLTDAHVEGFFPLIDKPRIPSLPMSLATVLQWIFLEYAFDSSAHPLSLSEGWLSAVRKAERLVLLPYFENALRSLRKTQAQEESCWATDFAYDGI